MKNKEVFKVSGEFLVDDKGNIAYKPLGFWLDYFGIKPIDGYECFFKTKDDKFIDIELRGGYGFIWSEKEDYINTLFFVGNADLDRMKIRQKIE